MDILFAILLILLGVIVGTIAMYAFNSIKNSKAQGKAEDILYKAQAEAERIKKDSIAEAKAEIT